MPAFERVVLPNGAVLILMPKKELPLVSVRMAVKGGAEADPPGLQGLAMITASMLTQGTESRSREKVGLDLDQMGIEVQAGAQQQFSSFQMEYLAKDNAKALVLLEDLLLHPSFSDEELKKLIAQRIDAVKVVKDQPQRALREYFPAFYFGKEHPYGRSMNGDELSLAKVTRASVLGFWKQNYVGKNIVVVVAGDFNPVTMREQMTSLIGKFPAGSAYEWKKPDVVVAGKESRLLLVDLPGATQTYFAIAQPGIDRTSADRTALELVNTLFGGRFTSMLNDALRVDSGLTYGANSIVQMDRLPGAIYISTFTKTETTVPAIDLALKQLEKLQSSGINAEQLASAKAYVKGEYPTRSLETADQLSTVLTDMEVYGLNRGEVDDFISRMDSINLEKANDTARKYYKTEGLVYVLIGDAAKIRKDVAKYAKKFTEVKIDQPGYGN